MTEETTEKKQRNGFLPWMVSMKVDEHADVTSSLPCRPLYLLSALIFLCCSFFLLLCHLLQPLCGRAAALYEPLWACRATAEAHLLLPADGIDVFRDAIDPLM